MASVDYWEYESQGLGLTISMMVIATLSVILRFVARAKKKTGWGADDWMIIPSLLCFYGFTSVNIWGEEPRPFDLARYLILVRLRHDTRRHWNHSRFITAPSGHFFREGLANPPL